MKQALIIFVRKPELGKVKTRLAAEIGNEKALEVYEKLLAHTKDICNEIAADKFVFYHEQIETDDIWQGEHFIKKVQQAAGLGEKMKVAFETVFQQGYEKVVIIGSDCFELSAEIIIKAYQLLQTKNLVIGPSTDGGYYLLGMMELLPSIFENKSWSTASVFATTIQEIQSAGKEYVLLPMLSDIDTNADLQRYYLSLNA